MLSAPRGILILGSPLRIVLVATSEIKATTYIGAPEIGSAYLRLQCSIMMWELGFYLKGCKFNSQLGHCCCTLEQGT